MAWRSNIRFPVANHRLLLFGQNAMDLHVAVVGPNMVNGGIVQGAMAACFKNTRAFFPNPCVLSDGEWLELSCRQHCNIENILEVYEPFWYLYRIELD